MIYCELLICMRNIDEGIIANGLYHSPPDNQNEVAKLWLKNHSLMFADDPEDKIWDYPASLKLVLPQ